MANVTLLPDSLCDKDVEPLRAIESDCDRAQGQLRTLTAAWSGAAFALLGTILVATARNDVGEQLRTNLNTAIHGACVAASFGTFAFGWIDQQVSQRLLHSVFGYGLLLENTTPGANTIRTKVRTALYVLNRDITPRITAFYLVQVALFFLVSLAFLFAPAPRHVSFVALLLITHFVFLVLAVCDSLSWPSLNPMMSDLAKADPSLKSAYDKVKALHPEKNHS